MTPVIKTTKLLEKKLSGFDFKSENNYLGLTKSQEIITPFYSFNIKHDFKFPLIRIFNEDLFLLVSSRTKPGIDNCLVYDMTGQLKNKFYLGDGVEDVVVFKKKIVVSYFDEGVLGEDGPNNNGVAVFNIKGQLLFGYNEKHGGLAIMDCYCMNRLDHHRLIFSAYSKFNIIELDLNDYSETEHIIPESLIGCSAVTTFQDKLFFHGPYKDKEGIYEWKLGEVAAQRIGAYKGNLRGLENGKFLSFKNKSYTLLELVLS